MTGAVALSDSPFLHNSKRVYYYVKMLREDRTAAEWKMLLTQPAAGGECRKRHPIFILEDM